MNVLVTGATGYIGGRLVPRLLQRGHNLRILVRDAHRVAGRPWAQNVDIVEGDLLQPATLAPALQDVQAAYYLVHSMDVGRAFAENDRAAAHNFADHAQHLHHVVYLGGLQPSSGHATTAHLRSRAETGEILRSRLPVTEFRAGPVIGSGSASFEMVRYLTERLPIMVAPKWILNPVQPIAIRSLLSYLVQALDHPPMGIVCIGSEPLSFKQMMLIYAQLRGLRRLIIPVPVLAPHLAALWVGLVTPIPNRLAVPLIEGVVEPLLVPDDKAARLFPDIVPIPYRQAVQLALSRMAEGQIETRWSGAMGASKPTQLGDWEGLIREKRSLPVNASTQRVFDILTSLGGERGWLVWNWAWRMRGLIDRVVGGPGHRRGRRDPHQLLVGETVDFWRVEVVDRPHLLRLRAEMKLPGQAWLQWETTDEHDNHCTLVQTAFFEPRGLPGVLYWCLLYPLHRLLFVRLIRAIAAESQRSAP
jgi:uncharacterized protein YbjT (DUF2867 family)